MALSFAAVLGHQSSARADALVVVEVRAGKAIADGTVTLTPKAGGKAHQCKTVRGSCTLDGVPGGLYTATIVPVAGKAPKPRTVMIPPSGRVELHLSIAKPAK